MTTDFRDIQSTVDSGRLRGGEGSAQRIGRPRPTLLDEADGASPETPFALPSVRAEAGALLERQLLISGGLETRRLPPTLGDRASRRVALLFGFFALALAGAGAAVLVHSRNVQEELRAELGARSEQIAAVRSENERLLREQREAELRLEETTSELEREVSEKRRAQLEKERQEGELNLARQELLSLRREIDGLKKRNSRLEAETLSELGELLQESLLGPLELFWSVSGPEEDAAAGPVPRELRVDGTAPLVGSPASFTERPVPPASPPTNDEKPSDERKTNDE